MWKMSYGTHDVSVPSTTDAQTGAPSAFFTTFSARLRRVIEKSFW